MTPLAQRIAIGAACSGVPLTKIWVYDMWETGCATGIIEGTGRWEVDINHTPDYLNDLDAMFAAEETLTDEQRRDYAHRLGLMIGPRGYDEWSGLYDFYLTHLTAAQRAEAFLKTIGKWEDDQ